MPGGDEALKLLHSVGSLVKPIMIKHGWTLPLLVEIYPKQDQLLGFNVNSGRKIALRLRRASNRVEFLDQESIIETMLHELAHNLRGPHDDVFFQHLDTLTREWYELQRSPTYSLVGQAFITSSGNRLGGSDGTRQLDPIEARRRAAAMAERRRRLAGLMAVREGEKVGGSNSGSTPLSAARAAAEAAERRRLITHSCPSASVEQTQRAAQEQQEQELLHGIQVITIDDDDDGDEVRCVQEAQSGRAASDEDEDEVVVLDVKRASRPAQPPSQPSQPAHLIKQTRAAAALRHDLLDGSESVGWLERGERASASSDITHRSRSWNCQRCTLLNPASDLTCQACSDIRPGLAHWICSRCHHAMLGDYAQYWCCTKCSQLKTG